MNCNISLLKDLQIRKDRLQSEMQKMGIDACILTTGVNVFYVAGSIYNGYFYLPAEGKAVHFLKRMTDSLLDNTVLIRKPEQMVEGLQNLGISLPKKVLLEVDAISFTECNRLVSALQIKQIENASTLLRQLRSVKSEFEILQVRKCAQKHVEVYNQIPTLYRSGMTDLEFQIEIEYLMRKSGSLGIFRSYGANMDIYMGSLLVGENAEALSPFDFALGGKGENSILPLGASGQKIQSGDAIMIDMAGNYAPWMTDVTRVFSVGKLSDLAYKAHNVSIEIHETIKQKTKQGVACADLYNISLDLVSKNNLEAYFMGTKLQAKFVGHGVGLEINEPPVLTPRSREVLASNMIFALEPKFVIPNVGAVGIENTYLVHDDNIENLTVLDENIIDLES